MGALKWSPSQFWACTFPEFYAAIDGLRAFEGVSDKPKGAPKHIDDWTPEQIKGTRDFLAEMQERFPDGRVKRAKIKGKANGAEPRGVPANRKRRAPDQ